MATPICWRTESSPQWASMQYCAEQCGAPYSNRRPACLHRAPRVWDNLPADMRAEMMGNKALTAMRKRQDRYLLALDTVEPSIKAAIRRSEAHNGKRLGRQAVTVPLEALQELIRLAGSRMGLPAILGAAGEAPEAALPVPMPPNPFASESNE